MARTHARVKGKSGSKKPVVKDLSFVTMKPAEVVKIIVALAKEDKKPSQIGIVLRDTYGVPDVKALVGKTVSKILEENKVVSTLPEDLQSLVDRATKIKKHLEANTRDLHNKRGLALVESKIRRLSNYYKKAGKVAANWRMN